MPREAGRWQAVGTMQHVALACSREPVGQGRRPLACECCHLNTAHLNAQLLENHAPHPSWRAGSSSRTRWCTAPARGAGCRWRWRWSAATCPMSTPVVEGRWCGGGRRAGGRVGRQQEGRQQEGRQQEGWQRQQRQGRQGQGQGQQDDGRLRHAQRRRTPPARSCPPPALFPCGPGAP